MRSSYKEVIMTISKFAAVMGSLFLAVGVMGFADGFVTPPHPDDPLLSVESNYGRLLGLFPINMLHNGVHALIGSQDCWPGETYGRPKLLQNLSAASTPC